MSNKSIILTKTMASLKINNMTDKERKTLLELNRQIFQEKENYTEEELSKIKIKYEKLKNKNE